MKDRVQIEDALKHLHECEYRSVSPGMESLAGALGIRQPQAAELLAELVDAGLLVPAGPSYQLTDDGRRYARQVLRAHRLYETYLARETGLRSRDWHPTADKREHDLSATDVADLSRQLGNPRFDPHGDPIPSASGILPAFKGVGAHEVPVGFEGRVLHIEDEPAAVYRAVAALGIAPGLVFRVEAPADEGRLTFNFDGKRERLTRPMAAALLVEALPEGQHFDETVRRLSALDDEGEAEVLSITPSLRGPERNRLLDLGVVPGTRITLALTGPSGNPRAYNIRGALIALRTRQADCIRVRLHPLSIPQP